MCSASWSPPRWIGTALLLAAVGAVAALYWQVLAFPLLRWDDPVYVMRPALRQLASGDTSALLALLSPGDALAGRFWEYYPVRDLTYALDALRGGALHGELDGRAFHQTSLLLHLANVLLVYALGRRLGLAGPAAALAAALFGLHPLTVEPAAWVSARKDLLYTGFSLLALLLVPRAGDRRVRWVFASLACLGAMASKGPGVVALLLCAWLLWLWRDAEPRTARPGRGWLALLAVGLVALAWLAFCVVVARRNSVIVTELYPQSIWRALGAPVAALARILLPLDLSPSHLLWPTRPWLDPYSWAGLLGLLALGLAWIRAGGPRRSIAWLVAGWVLLALAPTSGLLPVNQLRADRFLYLPLALAVLLAGSLVQRALRRAGGARAAAGLLVTLVVLAGLAWQTHSYVAVWRSDVTLWKHVVAQDPGHPVANGSLAALALEQGQLELAKQLLDRALELSPAAALNWSNLGRYWRYKAGPGPLLPGQRPRAALLDRAAGAFRRAIALDGRLPGPQAELGLIAWWQGDPVGAERHLRAALALPRCPPEAAIRLGDLLWSQGRQKEARAAVAADCQERPGLTACQRWLGEHGSR